MAVLLVHHLRRCSLLFLLVLWYWREAVMELDYQLVRQLGHDRGRNLKDSGFSFDENIKSTNTAGGEV